MTGGGAGMTKVAGMAEEVDNMSHFKGIIKSVTGQTVVVVITSSTLPQSGEIAHVSKSPEIKLEVLARIDTEVTCLILSESNTLLVRGQKVEGTGKPLSVPVGKQVLGKMLNLFGESSEGEDNFDLLAPIYAPAPSFSLAVNPTEILETGIKVIDFAMPIPRGGKVGVVGGAGMGKTVLLTEIILNIINRQEAYTVFAGIGERIREAQELYQRLKALKVLDKSSLVIGQMHENAANRFRIAQAAATIAEHFRDKGNDVLFFADNMFRFVQAGSEVSQILGEIPSEQFYQASLQNQVAEIEDRLVSTEDAAITSIQTVYVPADDFSDPAVSAIMTFLDTVIILSRGNAQLDLHPPVDLLQSSSSFLKRQILGERHFEVYTRFNGLLSSYVRLSHIAAIVGEEELGAADRLTFKRTRKVINYLTQPFFATESQTGRKGTHVKREDAVTDIEAILAGKLDNVPDEKLKYIGTLKEAKLI